MDAIVILGAAVWRDGPSPTLRRRTLHAATLWHAGVAPVVIPSGGLGQHPPTEAALMRELLLAANVPEECIILEDQSTSTLENIRNAKRLLPGSKVVIVTDRYHGRRAAMVARHFGLNAIVSSPNQHRVNIKHHIREALAIPTYAMRLRLIPKEDR